MTCENEVESTYCFDLQLLLLSDFDLDDLMYDDSRAPK